ncbi:2316_t:CDS:1 [Paraglomus occultum]|uniref:2316_t:CDS:1 n=1 Tax=Paraglomus occultum TaxID=144539 RepID=A0A9N9ANK7_9GLOM|nr:2316_t:CDS:1 [Paraglomus occultum]
MAFLQSKLSDIYGLVQFLFQRRVNELADRERFAIVLVIAPNVAWLNQHGWPAYYTVMDLFATYGLCPNQRRDNNSRCLFYFRGVYELFKVRDAIRNNMLAPTAFGVPLSCRTNCNPTVQMEPIGEAWILSKISTYDAGRDDHFFMI